MLAPIQRLFHTGLQQATAYAQKPAVKNMIDVIQNVVKPIFEVVLSAFLFYLNPYLFPIALFIGMARITCIDAGLENIMAVWQKCWPLVAIVMAPAIHWSCTAVTDRTVTAALACAAVVCGLYWGRRVSEWMQTRPAVPEHSY